MKISSCGINQRRHLLRRTHLKRGRITRPIEQYYLYQLFIPDDNRVGKMSHTITHKHVILFTEET